MCLNQVLQSSCESALKLALTSAVLSSLIERSYVFKRLVGYLRVITRVSSLP